MKELVIINDQKITLFNEIANRLWVLLSPLIKYATVEEKLTERPNTIYLILNPHHLRNQVKDNRDIRKKRNIWYLGWDLTNAISTKAYCCREYGAVDILLVDTYEKQSLIQQIHETHILSYGIDMVEAIPAPAEKDIDVVMIGMPTEERTCIANQCRQKGWEISYIEQGLYGQERNEILARAKIVLDVPRNKRFIFLPSVREYLAASHGCVVVTSGSYINRREHIVYTSLSGVVDTVQYLLEHPEKRRHYLDKFQSRQTFDDFKKVLEWIKMKEKKAR